MSFQSLDAHVVIAQPLFVCTHRTGWVVRMLPELETMVGPLPLYRWLQHASTAIGAALVALAIVRMPRHVVATVATAASRVARAAFVVIPVVVGVAAAVARVLVEVEHGGRVYGHAIVAFIAGALVGICVASLLVRRIGQSSPTFARTLAAHERGPTRR